MEKSWVDQVNRGALGIAEKMAQGFHAIPKPDPKNPLSEIPSVHRLLNVVGMVSGFAATQYLSNIIFACKINGSQCEEIPKEKVPLPLRPLHGLLEYNPFSDEPSAQWKKVLHQMLPAIGGALGAVKGSEFFFMHHNEREKDFIKWMKQDKINPIDADAAASFVQGKAWRKLAGMTAWLSSASGLTVLYGVALNNAFMLCNGGKIAGFKGLKAITGNASNLGWGPQKGLDDVLKGTERALRDGHTEEYAKQLVLTAIEPLTHLNEQQRQAFVAKLKSEVDSAVRDGGPDMHRTAESLKKHMRSEVMQIIAGTQVKDLDIGNNGVLGAIVAKFPGVPDQLKDIRRRIPEAILPSPISRGT